MEKLFERAQPSLDFAAAKYMGAHDTVVSSEAYSKALQSAHAFLAQLQTFALFRSLYATISPLADPTLGNITQSTYYEVWDAPGRRLADQAVRLLDGKDSIVNDWARHICLPAQHAS